MSPLCWDLAHIGHYEELWLVRELAGAEPTDAAVRRHLRRVQAPAPRAAVARRSSTPPARARSTPTCAHARSTCSTASSSIRGRSAARRRLRLRHGRAARAPARRDAARDAPAHGRLRAPRRRRRRAAAPRRRPTRRRSPHDVLVDGGTFTMGTTPSRGRTTTSAPRTPSTSPRSASTPRRSPTARTRVRRRPAATTTPAHWTDDGWAWRQEAGLVAPQFWTRDGDGAWSRRGSAAPRTVPLDEPVQHVCWYEADAFARWSGRAPPHRGRVGEAAAGRAASRRADLWRERTAPIRARTGRRPPGRRRAAWGVHSMLGDVWEWTASDFHAYPGSVRSRTASTPRCSSVPTTRCCAAGRGRRTRRPCAPRSATGTTRSAGRSSPASAARADA